MFNRITARTFYDAVLVALLGGIIAFSFNYTRKDGLPLNKRIISENQGEAAVAEQEGNSPSEPVWIELDEARRHFEQNDVLFIDARDEVEFVEGHIKGSVNIPYGWYLDEHPDISSIIDGNRVIITYCSGTECESSIQLAYAMWEKGYGGIKIFYGGWQEWLDAGLPTEKGM